MTILNPSSNTCCSIVWRTFAAASGFSAFRFGVRFRVGGVSARTGAILIGDRNLLRQRGQQELTDLPCSVWYPVEQRNLSGKMPDKTRWKLRSFELWLRGAARVFLT